MTDTYSKTDPGRLQRLREMTRQVIGLLTPRPEQILRMRFGVSQKPMTLEEIGETFGVTAKRIQQIKNKYKR